jgi:hypothetical protein
VSAAASPSSSLRRFADVRDLAPLVVYVHVGSASCLPLFELLHSLQLRYILRTCAQGSRTRVALILHLGSLFELLVPRDPNTGLCSRGKVDALSICDAPTWMRMTTMRRLDNRASLLLFLVLTPFD